MAKPGDDACLGPTPADRIESLIESAKSVFPEAGSEAARSVRILAVAADSFSLSRRCFQCANTGPCACGAVAQLLDVSPSALRLTQSDLWPKYGHASRHRQDNQDQRITWTTPIICLCIRHLGLLRRRWKSSSITLTRENAREKLDSFSVPASLTLLTCIRIPNPLA